MPCYEIFASLENAVACQDTRGSVSVDFPRMGWVDVIVVLGLWKVLAFCK